MTRPVVKLVEKRLVEEAVVANEFVEVAFVEVELSAVKFWRVEEPESKRLDKVARPVEVMFPTLAIAVAKRFVELAVVAKELVLVAFVLVELRAVKLSKVEEPERSKFEREESPVTERVPVAEMFAKERVPEMKPLPTTERAEKGEVVAMPRKPLE